MKRPSKSKPTRRATLGGSEESGAEQLAVASEHQQQGREAGVSYAYVGCYTTVERYARGDGIHV